MPLIKMTRAVSSARIFKLKFFLYDITFIVSNSFAVGETIALLVFVMQ